MIVWLVHAPDLATDPLGVSDDKKKGLLSVTHEYGEKESKVLRLRLTNKEERRKKEKKTKSVVCKHRQIRQGQ